MALAVIAKAAHLKRAKGRSRIAALSHPALKRWSSNPWESHGTSLEEIGTH